MNLSAATCRPLAPRGGEEEKRGEQREDVKRGGSVWLIRQLFHSNLLICRHTGGGGRRGGGGGGLKGLRAFYSPRIPLSLSVNPSVEAENDSPTSSPLHTTSPPAVTWPPPPFFHPSAPLLTSFLPSFLVFLSTWRLLVHLLCVLLLLHLQLVFIFIFSSHSSYFLSSPPSFLSSVVDVGF